MANQNDPTLDATPEIVAILKDRERWEDLSTSIFVWIEQVVPDRVDAAAAKAGLTPQELLTLMLQCESNRLEKEKLRTENLGFWIRLLSWATPPVLVLSVFVTAWLTRIDQEADTKKELTCSFGKVVEQAAGLTKGTLSDMVCAREPPPQAPEIHDPDREPIERCFDALMAVAAGKNESAIAELKPAAKPQPEPCPGESAIGMYGAWLLEQPWSPGETLVQLGKMQREDSKEYRLLLEQVKVSVTPNSDHHVEFKILGRAADAAIQAQATTEMVEYLEHWSAAGRPLRLLRVGHEKDWSNIMNKLRNRDQSEPASEPKEIAEEEHHVGHQ